MPFAPDGSLIGEGDPEAQARQVFTNMRGVLAAANADFDNVIKLTYYVTDTAHLPAILAVRDEFIGTKRPPASTVVQVAALHRPELLPAVDAFALVPPTAPATNRETRCPSPNRPRPAPCRTRPSTASSTAPCARSRAPCRPRSPPASSRPAARWRGSAASPTTTSGAAARSP